MIITCYRSIQFKGIIHYETDQIWGTLDPDEMTDEDRKTMQNGKAMPMCCFATEDGASHAVPWEFVISISESCTSH